LKHIWLDFQQAEHVCSAKNALRPVSAPDMKKQPAAAMRRERGRRTGCGGSLHRDVI